MVFTPMKSIRRQRIKTVVTHKIKSKYPAKNLRGELKLVTDGPETPRKPSPSHTTSVSRSAHLELVQFSALNLNRMAWQTTPLREILGLHNLVPSTSAEANGGATCTNQQTNVTGAVGADVRYS